MLVIGLTQGMQPIIGYNHGAMKPGRVLLTLKYGVLAGTSFTTLGFLACVFFPRGIAGLFTDDASLISLAANGLIICVLAFPLIGSQIIIGNFFQAIGKARLAIFLSLTRQMLFLLPFPAGPAPFLGTGRSLGIPSSGRRAFLYRHPALHPPIPEILPAEKQALPGSRLRKGIIFLPTCLTYTNPRSRPILSGVRQGSETAFPSFGENLPAYRLPLASFAGT